MPFYEYRCDSCQHEESFLESIKALQTKTCPQCGKRRAFKRMMSAAGFQLKGDGWYVTDFRDKAKKEDKKSADKDEKTTDKPDKPDKADKAESKTDKSDKPAKSDKADKADKPAATEKTKDKGTQK